MSQDDPAQEQSLPVVPAAPRRTRRRLTATMVLGALIALWLGAAYWQSVKPLPPGTDVSSPWYPEPDSSVHFLADLTTADAYGRPVISTPIADAALQVVRTAREFIVLDDLLVSAAISSTSATPTGVTLSAALRAGLIERKQAEPHLQILFITDAASNRDRITLAADLQRLRAAGIDVVVADRGRLRDPNVLWPRSSIHESDHRALLVADDGSGGLAGIVFTASSAAEEDSSSCVALRVAGPALGPLLASEVAIARFSGWAGMLAAPAAAPPTAPAAASPDASPDASPETAPEQSRADDQRTGTLRVRVLTEGAIRDDLLEHIDAASRGESIDLALYRISDRAIIEALLAASARGVNVRLILDPGGDAADSSGAAGLPNRPASSELVAASDGDIRVRWYRTHGERFRDALVMVYGPDRVWLTVGSANLTRRSLENYNLEANVAADAARGSSLAGDAIGYFDTLWDNRAPPGVEYTEDVGVYADASQLHYWWYRFTEATGLGGY